MGGAAGAMSRYGISLAFGSRPFPVGTLAINVVGSFFLGMVLTAGAAGRLNPQSTAALAVGLLGGFTTYSTFSWELFVLGRADRFAEATMYAALSLALGVVAAALGYRVGHWLAG